MKRPHTVVHPRPTSATGSVARTPKQAAIQLVRLEFDRSRLDLAEEQSMARARARQTAQIELEQKRAALLRTLNRG